MTSDVTAEFDRQVANLVDRGYPALAGLDEEGFRALVGPLRSAARSGAPDPDAGRVPFLLVVTRKVVPIEETMPRTTLHRGACPGSSTTPSNRGRWSGSPPLWTCPLRTPTCCSTSSVVKSSARSPNDAMETIAGRERTPLTIEEGIALVTHFPEVLVKNKCFSVGGSRCGDRRVPAIWISKRAPKLGWCWQGNPHTWLGVASAGARGA